MNKVCNCIVNKKSSGIISKFVGDARSNGMATLVRTTFGNVNIRSVSGSRYYHKLAQHDVMHKLIARNNKMLLFSSSAQTVDYNSDDNNGVDMSKIVQRQSMALPPQSTPLDSSVKVNRFQHKNVKSTSTVSLEQQETAILVDELLKRTHDLMNHLVISSSNTDETDRDGSITSNELTSSIYHHVVAFSGGIDSSLVVALLKECCDGDDKHGVKAMMGKSAAVSFEQINMAKEVLNHLQMPYIQVNTTEGNENLYLKNEGQACYACKTNLYSTIIQKGIHDYIMKYDQRQDKTKHKNGSMTNENYNYFQLYNGTNADDMKDSTRVGLVAAKEYSVASPLQYTTKANVRHAAKYLGLPNWNAAASPCLRSRLALGVEATSKHLHRIELAERYVRKQLLVPINDGTIFTESSNMRVRQLSKNRARIELDHDIVKFLLTLAETDSSSTGLTMITGMSQSPLSLQKVAGKDSTAPNDNCRFEKLSNYFTQELEFASLQIHPFKSGSVSKK